MQSTLADLLFNNCIRKSALPMSEYTIKPEKSTPAIDTSSWPLLLKVSTFVRAQVEVKGKSQVSASMNMECLFGHLEDKFVNAMIL